MNTQQRKLIAAVSLCVAVAIPSLATAAGPGGHMPLTNPGTIPSGRSLPEMAA